jgi:hypothetical protein
MSRNHCLKKFVVQVKDEFPPSLKFTFSHQTLESCISVSPLPDLNSFALIVLNTEKAITWKKLYP